MKGVIFDLDGTLIDSMGYWSKVAIKYLLTKNIIVDRETESIIDKLPVRKSSVFIKEKYNLPESAQEIAAEIYSTIENDYKFNIPLKKYTKLFLAKLKKNGVKMCIATATDMHIIEHAIKRLDIADYFEFIITAKEVEMPKYEGPAIYEAALKKLGMDKKDVVVFEDAPFAVKTAREAGFYVVGVYDKYFEKDLEETKNTANEFIYSFKEYKIKDVSHRRVELNAPYTYQI